MLSPLDKGRVVALGKATAPAASGTAGAAAAANATRHGRSRRLDRYLTSAIPPYYIIQLSSVPRDFVGSAPSAKKQPEEVMPRAF